MDMLHLSEQLQRAMLIAEKLIEGVSEERLEGCKRIMELGAHYQGVVKGAQVSGGVLPLETGSVIYRFCRIVESMGRDNGVVQPA